MISMDIEKKFQEMEASIKAIAEYVKQQTGKLEEEISSINAEPAEEYKDDIEDLRRRIESFNDEKEFSRLQFKKLDKLEQAIDERIEKIEGITRSAGVDEKMKKTLQSTRAEVDSLKRDIVSKTKFLEEKLEKASDGHEIKKELKEEITRLEKEVSEMKTAKKAKDAGLDTYKKELEGLNHDMFEEVKARVGASEKSLDDIASRLENFKSPGEDLEKFKSDVASRLSILDKGIKEIAGIDHEELKEQVSLIDNKLNESLVLKNHLDDMEKSLDEMKSIASRLKGFDAESYKKEFEKRMNDALSQAHQLEAGDVKKLNEMFSKIKNLEAEDIEKVRNMSQFAAQLKEAQEMFSQLRGIESRDIGKINNTLSNIKKLEDDDIKNIQNFSDTLSQLKRLEIKDVKKLNEALDNLMESEIKDIKSLAKQMKEAKELIEEDTVSRMSVEKRLSDMESNIGKFEKHIGDTLGQLKNLEISDVRRLSTMLEHMQGIELEEMKEIAKNIKEAKDALEDESVNRMSIEKRLAGMEAKVSKVSEVVGHIENIEGLDVQKLSSRINDIEGDMKMNTVKMLTQQLNEFAKSMDRRLPNVVSREEYMRQIADLNQRMRTIEAPDLSPLGSRVERLERKIEEVASMMRQMYDRVPIVVE